MVTIKDVARDAGVSTATVSCCLSGSRSVSPKTRMKIMDSVQKLNYIPNLAARSLKKNSSGNIGVILTDITEAYQANIFKGIFSFLRQNGYTANLAFSDGSAYMEAQFIDDFISQNAAGLLIVTSMPENTEFFQSRLISRKLPCVFLERIPQRISADFAGFDNRKAVFFLTSQLLNRSYKKITLVSGPCAYTSEAESISGFCEAFREHGLSANPKRMLQTGMTREDSFQTVLSGLDLFSTEAVIATSPTIALGIQEALQMHSPFASSAPLILTLAEDRWSRAPFSRQMLQISRSPFLLGQKAAELLLSRIREPGSKSRRLLLDDPIAETDVCIPPPPVSLCPAVHASDSPLRILMADLATPNAVRLLSDNFTRNSGIPVKIDTVPHDRLWQTIAEQVPDKNCPYDLYMCDVAWIPYAARSGLALDMTGYIRSKAYPAKRIFPHNLENCAYAGKYYGIPFSGGSQLMLYRRDLFEDHTIIKEYRQKYSLPLRPPRTWDEFNQTAEFFTRSVRPDSPTEFGASLAGDLDEELAPEILVRLWACGGSLYDPYSRASLDTPECAQAFRLLLQTARCCRRPLLKSSITRTVSDFCSGKTAMLITYSEYASAISKSMRQNIIGQVGYSLLPGKISIRSGWALSVVPGTPKNDAVFQYFNWLCQKQTAYYITIMGGQSPVTAPSRSPELLKLYPWLELIGAESAFSQPRSGPHTARKAPLPANEMEAILCSAFRDVAEGGYSIPDSLKKWQPRLEALFKSHGYPGATHFSRPQ